MGLIIPKYTFTAWCDKEKVSDEERESFRQWLKHHAGGERTSREWFALWDRFVRKNRNKF